MNKKLIAALTTLIVLIPTASNAAFKSSTLPTPTIAILDTALDTSIAEFQGKIAYEVCIIQWKTCPNGKEFMEGPGSAVLPINVMSNRNFNHGTQMASVSIYNNPNMQIVFIRIIGNTIFGDRQSVSPAYVSKALDWVAMNKDKFNIQAVAMSQGHHTLLNGVNYCPLNSSVDKSISNLITLGIPSFFASGNIGDAKRIDWPACIPQAVSVGATSDNGEVAFYSNNDDILLDFLANGTSKVIYPGGTFGYGLGTSVSAQVAAAYWIALKQARPGLTYDKYMSLLTSTTDISKSTRGTYKKLINLQAAING
jgi:hypothetical protein